MHSRWQQLFSCIHISPLYAHSRDCYRKSESCKSVPTQHTQQVPTTAQATPTMPCVLDYSLVSCRNCLGSLKKLTQPYRQQHKKPTWPHFMRVEGANINIYSFPFQSIPFHCSSPPFHIHQIQTLHIGCPNHLYRPNLSTLLASHMTIQMCGLFNVHCTYTIHTFKVPRFHTTPSQFSDPRTNKYAWYALHNCRYSSSDFHDASHCIFYTPK